MRKRLQNRNKKEKERLTQSMKGNRKNYFFKQQVKNMEIIVKRKKWTEGT